MRSKDFCLSKMAAVIKEIETWFSGEYWLIFYVLKHCSLIKGTTMKSGESINILCVILMQISM